MAGRSESLLKGDCATGGKADATRSVAQDIAAADRRSCRVGRRVPKAGARSPLGALRRARNERNATSGFPGEGVLTDRIEDWLRMHGTDATPVQEALHGIQFAEPPARDPRIPPAADPGRRCPPMAVLAWRGRAGRTIGPALRMNAPMCCRSTSRVTARCRPSRGESARSWEPPIALICRAPGQPVVELPCSGLGPESQTAYSS